MLIKRYLIPSDYSAAESWRLVEWCRSVGANEFTVDFVSSSAAGAADRWEQFEEVVRSLSLGEAVRERMTGRTADDLMRATERWTLDESSIAALEDALPGGLFEYEPHQDGWFEDPVFYRDGELLLGVLSHEAFAVVKLTLSEAADFDAARFRSHESLPRAG